MHYFKGEGLQFLMGLVGLLRLVIIRVANFEQSMRDTLQVLFNANKLRSNFHNECFQFRLQC